MVTEATADPVPTIADLRDLQAELGLLTTHVVWLDETGFVIAHTAAERANQGAVSLTACELHRQLSALDFSSSRFTEGFYRGDALASLTDLPCWYCPRCRHLNRERHETEVGCEDCGTHPALWCDGCDEALDTVYWDP